MKFTWDEPKRLANLGKHGMDLADAERLRWREVLVVPARAGKRGEPRFRATGLLDDQLVSVIFSPLGTEAYAIISLRPASSEERKAYDHA